MRGWYRVTRSEIQDGLQSKDGCERWTPIKTNSNRKKTTNNAVSLYRPASLPSPFHFPIFLFTVTTSLLAGVKPPLATLAWVQPGSKRGGWGRGPEPVIRWGSLISTTARGPTVVLRTDDSNKLPLLGRKRRAAGTGEPFHPPSPPPLPAPIPPPVASCGPG